MLIAIASGKGGTGKTTVATNLAAAWRRLEDQVQLLDADVEAPNCRLLLHPVIRRSVAVNVSVPVVDEQRCDHCGKCAEICRFGAIVCWGSVPQVFPELCHDCGGCGLICPRGAIEYRPREVGWIEEGQARGLMFVEGRLNVGEPQAVPVVKALRRRAAKDGVVLIDAPPGAGCPVSAAIKGCDYVCLVAESTPFGLHDLDLTVALARELDVPIGVVINRVGIGDDRVQRYCDERSITVLGQIPDDRRIGMAQGRGRLAIDEVPKLSEVFESLIDRMTRRMSV